MNRRFQLVRGIVASVAIAALLIGTGCSGLRSATETYSSGAADSAGSMSAVEGVAPITSDKQAAQPVPTEAGSVPAETVSAERMIVSNSSMSLQVDDVDTSLDAVRALAASSGSQITNLSVQAGDGGVMPLAEGAASVQTQSSAAQVTLRVPAEKLASVEAEAAKLGKVLSQSASEDDVTQQHIDLEARLKNLQAEEVRLRGFLDQATKVTEMLEVERELSRVRGEIESMQAQIAYLEQQAAMATLTLALSAPGSLVQPSGGTWGFGTAITTGVQAAAAVIKTLIVLIIALSPVLLVVAIVVLVWRSRRRSKTAARARAEQEAADSAELEAGADAPPSDPTDSTGV